METSKRSDSYYKAHELIQKGDPLVNGPYLDDVRAKAQEEYRRYREDALAKAEAASSKEKKVESEKEDTLFAEEVEEDSGW